MKKFLLLFLVLPLVLIAEVQNIAATSAFFDKKIPVIDIRTPGEWKETGIVKGAHTIMFFDEKGGYNIEDFISKLNKVVKKDEPFALICRTGSRTTTISGFLDKEYGYKVINLQGGMIQLFREGYIPTPYTP